MLYQYTIYPIECVYKILYLFFAEALDHYGLALIVLSLMTSFIIHPFMKWAAKLQKEEKHLQDVMKPQLDIIKEESKGAEQYERIQRMYKRYRYHPVMAIRSAIGVALQIPFLMAAFYMLSKLPDIQGISWGVIRDLGKPDGLLLGRFNVLPVVMTAVNLLGAYTTKGFSKRDRMQAIVIAALFLVLLYTAPSALLIYWTCNNFWTLIGNIINVISERFAITMPWAIIKGKSLTEWITEAPDVLYVCLALAGTVCVFVPADVYLVNSNESWFSLLDILRYLLLFFAGGFLVLAIIYFSFPNQKLRLVFIAILLGLLIGFWLQSYVINLDYGILDGRKIKWNSFKKESFLNCIVWISCFLTPFIALRYLKAEIFLKIAKKLSVFLIIVQICSSFYVAGTRDIKQAKMVDNLMLSKEEQFTVSSKENIIVFVLDTFDSKTFEKIQKTNPELVKKLEGFTFYPNASSFFGYTDYSIPQMLTNKVFVNQCLYKEYLKDAWEQTQFYKYLRSKNYDIRLFTFSNFLYGANGQIDNLENVKYAVDRTTAKSFMKLAFFREMPHVLKKRFVIESGLLRDPVVANTVKEAYKEDDVKFYNELVKNGIQIRNDKNCFRFYHLKGAHGFYTMNADIKRVKKDQTTMYEQAVGAFKIALEFIDQLKNKKAFDNTTFVITADHGRHNSIGTAPLVLVRQPDSPKIPMVTKRNAISFSGWHATLTQRYGNESMVFGEIFDKENKKRRDFYLVKNVQNQDISLIQYEITGSAENSKSYKKIKTIQTAAVSSDKSYSLGKRIVFSPLGTSSKYVMSGWEQAIVKYRWINKDKGRIDFTLHNYSGTDLTLYVWGYPSLIDKAPSRNISVYIGNKKICTWKINKYDCYKAVIPKSLVDPRQLVITFKIENPVPKKFDAKNRQFRVHFLEIR